MQLGETLDLFPKVGYMSEEPNKTLEKIKDMKWGKVQCLRHGEPRLPW